MIVEITNYYARPGMEGQVLAQRRRATTIRVALGLPPGRIFKRLEGEGPDVRWECAFATRDDYERDRAARAASAEFEAAKTAMHGLVARFERHVQRLVEDVA